jgi:hypothetical protein
LVGPGVEPHIAIYALFRPECAIRASDMRPETRYEEPRSIANPAMDRSRRCPDTHPGPMENPVPLENSAVVLTWGSAAADPCGWDPREVPLTLTYMIVRGRPSAAGGAYADRIAARSSQRETRWKKTRPALSHSVSAPGPGRKPH